MSILYVFEERDDPCADIVVYPRFRASSISANILVVCTFIDIYLLSAIYYLHLNIGV